ncbi:DUF1559 domain-containing protein [Thalassoroseus pseudoceratinae]|uniref:DUF1559 domain-containing protein n=1 Tax=Thalassoroseus pseudoceratinae TaxID=2713176 RepID=UPI00141E96DF|nr:DUF1559 domain-containing protein [Thalassoroseus pseudoceratinae]
MINSAHHHQSRRENAGRRGWTITEFTICVAVVGLLGVLTLPAVEQSRSVARRTQCGERLKNIGLALQAYQETADVFPSGWYQTTNEAGRGGGYGWQCSLLGFLDEISLINEIDAELSFEQPFPKADAAKLLQTSVSAYRCPADLMMDLNPARGGYATSNYSGNFGDTALPRWITGRRTASWPGQLPTPKESNGIFCWNSAIGLESITDGTANTFLVGERCVTSGAGIWPGVGANEFENDQVTDCHHISRLNNGPRSFSSLHDGGANFLFADGSVKFLSDRIESLPGQGGRMGIYQKLANRFDGRPVSLPE